MSDPRWGILGGTFDPVHYAHLAIAEEARESLALDLVLFVPAHQTVHKSPAAVTPAAHRLAMVQLAVEDNQGFRTSAIELERGGPSYSVHTLEELARGNPGTEFVFLMSAEAARSVPTWRDPRRLLELSRVAIIPRLGYETPTRAWLAEQFPGQDERFLYLKVPPLGHSASDIRARVRNGRSIRYLVPPAVQEYIVQHGLYRTHD